MVQFNYQHFLLNTCRINLEVIHEKVMCRCMVADSHQCTTIQVLNLVLNLFKFQVLRQLLIIYGYLFEKEENKQANRICLIIAHYKMSNDNARL